ncbi:MAG TPA: hypothetical protein VFF02_21345 [Anaeromyxobacteraceae bacterium]|nr:hypothetical protein [Anaeromyxobacteraceae bacterium]
MRARVAACLLLAACAGTRPPPGAADPAGPAEEAGRVLSRFAAAVREGRLDEAWPLLSARWRARSTPASLAADLEASGRVGRDAAERAQALLAAGRRPAVEGDRAALAVGEGKAARLVLEDGVWRVEALE